MHLLFPGSIKTIVISRIQRIFFIGGLVLLTLIFCAAPDFHPEAVLGLPYHWALDALFHGSYYFVITLLLFRYGSKKIGAGLFYGTMLLLCFLLEVAQVWIPGRSLTGLDLMANTVGITGATVLQIIRYQYKAY